MNGIICLGDIMIRINLSKLLGEKRISQRQLSRLANVRPNTINAYYNEYIERFNKADLNKICKALDCSLTDLIEYIPDKE